MQLDNLDVIYTDLQAVPWNADEYNLMRQHTNHVFQIIHF